MKNYSTKFFFFIFLIIFPLSVYPASWVFIGETSGGDKFYIEVGSIKSDNKHVKYWSRFDAAQPTDALSQLYRTDFLIRETSQHLADCGRGVVKTLSISEENVQVPSMTYNKNEPFHEPIPGSLEENGMNYACSFVRKKGK